MAHILAFDLGASGGRAILGRWDGERFSIEELHRFENGPIDLLGSLHWDAIQLWAEIKKGLVAYTARYQEPLLSIGIDTWGVDYGLLDQHGKLLGNPYNYRDQRTNGMIEAIDTAVGKDAVFSTTGIQFLSINTLYQLYAAVQQHDPQLAIAETLLLMPDLFHYWMTGRKAVEYTNASTTQLLDCHTRTWATPLLRELGIPTNMLPEIVEPGTILGPLRQAICQEVGLKQAPLVITPATHDTASAVAAIPGLDAASAYISSGTWSLVGVETTKPIVGQRAMQVNVTNEGGVAGTIRLLKNVSGLWLLQESRRQWQREGQQYTWEELLAAAEQAPALVSLIDPDRAEFAHPGDLPSAIRAFCRNSAQPEPRSVGALVRCCLESLALRYRWVIEALEELTGDQISTIRVVGGGSRNQLLCQYTADACGLPVVAGPVEATALGNVAIQAISAGLVADLAAARQALAKSVTLTTYQPQDSTIWAEAYARFAKLVL